LADNACTQEGSIYGLWRRENGHWVLARFNHYPESLESRPSLLEAARKAMRQAGNMAVLFADITGSTRIFSMVGDAAARRIESEWLQQVRGLLPEYEGRLVKTIGDEVMCVFPTADTGVLAASAIQAAVTADPPAGYNIELHIGVHTGDVIVEDNDVFGDTVNIAAYLTGVASSLQIVVVEHTVARLSDSLKFVVRPIFRTVLKGQASDVIVYQVLWKTDRAELTDSFFADRSHPWIPADTGGLVVTYRGKVINLNHQLSRATLGRHSSCDIVVLDTTASRQHARIELQNLNFYLVDQSINATYVIAEDHAEIELLRRDLRLEGSGKISLGRSFRQNPTEVITFARDRRSMFRV
jgi:adenylate cyclase